MSIILRNHSKSLRWRAILVLAFSVTGCVWESHPLKAQPQKEHAGAVPNPPDPAAERSGEQLPEALAAPEPEPGNVVVDGRPVLTVYQNIGTFTAKDRAAKIGERIVAAAEERVDPKSVEVSVRPMWTEISAGGKTLLAITEEDAKAAGKSRSALAAEDAENVRQALFAYRRDHSVGAFLKGAAYSVLATILLVVLALVVRKARLSASARLERWIEHRKRQEPKGTPLDIAITYLASAPLALGAIIRWILLIALFEVYVTFILSFFPGTRALSSGVTGWVMGALQSIGAAALNYLPNLFVVAVITIVARQLSRLIIMMFGEIAARTVAIKGFYPEWAEPSSKLIRLMLWALVIVVIFPYLPGSKSPAFQGISIFVGVLLSLGSSSAVANAIAGIILTYMRSYSVGDWVRIGDTVGEVQEKNMLVTRILTPKQETITIPNATIMSGSVMNFTSEAKNAGVIFHTTVTIGYDAPWKIVHRLLIEAATATEHVLQNPRPFVLQTALNDFYVSYELNAYTDFPRRMQFIYSDLHQNIQDRFNEAGVEICSPHFASLRDGNTIAIPSQYFSRDYVAPGFQVQVQEKDVASVSPMRG